MSRSAAVALRIGLVVTLGFGAGATAMNGAERASHGGVDVASSRPQAPLTPDAETAATDPPQAPADQKPQAPVFRAGVNAVRVDVLVTDRQGNAVTDLTALDLEVLEDGKPQTVDLFKFISSNGTPAPGADPPRQIRSMYDEEAEARRDDVRMFVIFLDDYHVRFQNAVRVREALVQFLTTQLGPLDLVAIMMPLTPVTGLTFTHDTESLVQIVRKFEGRKFNYAVRNAFEQEYVQYPPQVIETLRNQVTLSALEGLPVRLGSLREGRKAVILVSEGFTGLLPTQLTGPMAGMPGAPTTSADPRAEDRARNLAEFDIQQKLRDITDVANRNNTAIYPLDPRGLAVGEYDAMTDNIDQRTSMDALRQSQETLRQLSLNTDGTTITNRNDLAGGLKQVVRDTSSYYLIGYNSSLTAPDGKFHRIDVRVKRPGAQVRSRKGYWAPTAEEAARAAAPPKPRPPAAVERALSAVEGVPRENVTASWLGMSRGEDGKTRLTYVWDPLPPVPGEKRPEPARVVIVATAGGNIVFRGRVPDEAPAASGTTPPTNLPAPAAAGAAALRASSRISFDVRPGKVQIRTSVENAAGQSLDETQQEFAIPDFTAPKTALATPSVFCAHTPREMQALLRDPDPIPTALRLFRRTDRLLIRFAVYGASGEAPAVTARLLNRIGQKMTDLTVKAPDAGGGTSQIDLPLAGLSPGEYVIEVKVVGASGESTELIAIRVSS